MARDKAVWYFAVFSCGGSLEYGPYSWIEAKRLSNRNGGTMPYRKDSVIFPTTRPTKQDAKEERAVYEWPDGTWCWPEELNEMGHMSDDYYLTWYNPEVHK